MNLPNFLRPKVLAQAVLRLAGYTRSGVRETIVALAIVAVSSVTAGVLLGKNISRLEQLPGLLLMVPAAVALRGNIFGAVGARLGTAIHAGTFRFSFRLSARPTSVVGENVVGSLLLNLILSLVLAVMGKAFAVVFGIAESISLTEFIAISVTGGAFASVLMLGVALALSTLSVKFNWDPDSITVPIITSISDAITLPALFIAIWFFDIERYANILTPSYFGVIMLLAGLAWQLAPRPLIRLLNESAPVLIAAIAFDLFAGIAVESRLDRLATVPSLLVLLPGYLAMAGSLGGILSSKLATKFHLGMAAPARIPDNHARTDLAGVAVLVLPGYLLLFVMAQLAAAVFGIASPGLVDLLLVALTGGTVLVLIIMVVGYYATMVSVRAGVNPDTYGIPIITAVLDLVGAFVLILAIDLVGVV